MDDAIDCSDDHTPRLVLVWPDATAGATASRVSAIRARTDRLGSVPIVLVAADDRDLPVGVDQRVADPMTVDLAATWRPVGNDSIDRLVDTFGAAAVRELIGKLRTMLVAVLDDLDADMVRDLAHRIVGACGTLGYREASDAWQTPDDLAALRIVTRRTIYRIACDLDRLASPVPPIAPEGQAGSSLD